MQIDILYPLTVLLFVGVFCIFYKLLTIPTVKEELTNIFSTFLDNSSQIIDCGIYAPMDTSNLFVDSISPACNFDFKYDIHLQSKW